MDLYAYRRCSAGQYPYVVQPGDTLNMIAYRLETSVSRIMAANPGVDPYRLQIGQTLCIPACPPNHVPVVIQPGDTLYRLAQAHRVSVAAILEANPGVDPNALRVGQRLCIPAVAAGGHTTDAQTMIAAMQRDIDMLVKESDVQQTEQTNYGDSTERTRAASVTGTSIRFDAAPVTFQGDYRGQYTAGQSYPYYADAAMGGQRGITVKDNFGVWHSFGYHVDIGA